MTTPQSSKGLSNLLRLAGLKNVSGRRRVLGDLPYMEDMDNIDQDVAGTATSPTAPTENLPEADLGGELTSQSYDVRANQVLPPEQITPPEVATQQPIQQPVPEEEPLSSVAQGAKELPSNIWNALKNLKSKGLERQKELEQKAQAIREAVPYGPENKPPERIGFTPPYIQPPKESLLASLKPSEEWIQKGPERLQQAQEEQKALLARMKGEQNPEVAQISENISPEEKAEAEQEEAYKQFSTSKIASDPQLSQQFKEQTGMELTPELQQHTLAGEKVIQDFENGTNLVETGSDELAKQLLDNIKKNQTTENDKLLIGLALAMPLIIGGIFGKEAGLGALAGGAKGYADILGKRQADTLEKQKMLADIYKEQEKGGGPAPMSQPTIAYVKSIDEAAEPAKAILKQANDLMDLLKKGAKTGGRGFYKHFKPVEPTDIAVFDSGVKNLLAQYTNFTARGLTGTEFVNLSEEAIPNVKLPAEANAAILRNYINQAQGVINKQKTIAKVHRKLGYIPDDIRSYVLEEEELAQKKSPQENPQKLAKSSAYVEGKA